MTDPNAPQQGGMSDEMATLRERGADELSQTRQGDQSDQDADQGQPAQATRQEGGSDDQPRGGKRSRRSRS